MPPGGWQQPPAPGHYRPAAAAAWQGGELASWGSRVGASLIDMAIILFGFGLVAGALIGGGFAVSTGVGIAAAIVFGLAYLVITILYAAWLEKREGAHNGQTWGKQAMGIRVTWDHGGPGSFGDTAMREILVKNFGLGLAASFTAGIAYLVDYLWPLFDDENRALHDMLCKTHVERA